MANEKVNQEVVTSVDPSKVPFKNTTVGKTVRTFFQGIAGVLLVFVLSDDFRSYVTNKYPSLAVMLPLAAALFTAIQNAIDPNVKNI